jgi:hypothetical protein
MNNARAIINARIFSSLGTRLNAIHRRSGERRSATIAARTASRGELIRSVCSTAKNRRFVLPSIGEDQA